MSLVGLRTENHFVGFEVLTALVMKNPIFWGITTCSLLKVNRRFVLTYRLRLQAYQVCGPQSLVH
jgi:hypothetical protein